MSEWQPIETAPKDGTWIRAYGTARWDGDTWNRAVTGAFTAFWWIPEAHDDEDGRWALVSANPYTDILDATHWKPREDAPHAP